MSPPREVFERITVWSALRRNSKWHEFEAAVVPVFHRGIVTTAWGPMPVGLSNEARKLHLARLRIFFMVFLRDECTTGERVVADVFRRHWTPPPHLSLSDCVALQRDVSWERIIEAIERRPFERIRTPDVDKMTLPAISFLHPRSSALERLIWLGLDPKHYSVDADAPKRVGAKPEMARDRRAKRLEAWPQNRRRGLRLIDE